MLFYANIFCRLFMTFFKFDISFIVFGLGDKGGSPL